MRSPVFRLSILAAAVLLAACGSDVASPVAARPDASATKPALLVAPGENQNTILDTVDAVGNRTMIVEYAAGIIQGQNGEPSTSIGSVTIRTFIPISGPGATSRGPCITSTIEGTETTPGWTASIKKAVAATTDSHRSEPAVHPGRLRTIHASALMSAVCSTRFGAPCLATPSIARPICSVVVAEFGISRTNIGISGRATA